jgi:hypothetical protein
MLQRQLQSGRFAVSLGAVAQRPLKLLLADWLAK